MLGSIDKVIPNAGPAQATLPKGINMAENALKSITHPQPLKKMEAKVAPAAPSGLRTSVRPTVEARPRAGAKPSISKRISKRY